MLYLKHYKACIYTNLGIEIDQLEDRNIIGMVTMVSFLSGKVTVVTVPIICRAFVKAGPREHAKQHGPSDTECSTIFIVTHREITYNSANHVEIYSKALRERHSSAYSRRIRDRSYIQCLSIDHYIIAIAKNYFA